MNESDGGVLLNVQVNPDDAAKEFDKLARKAQGIEEKLAPAKLELEKAKAEAAELGARLDEAKARLERMKNSGQATAEQLAEQKETVASIQHRFDRAASNAERLTASTQKTENSLAAVRSKAAALAPEMGLATKNAEDFNATVFKGGPAIDKMGDNVSRLARRIARLAKRVLIFSVITRGLREVRSWFADVIRTDKEATKAIAQLKGALLTLVQPLLNVVIPAFTRFVQVLTAVVYHIAELVSGLFGMTTEESANAAEKLNAEKNAIKGVGSAAKKASKDLASFDEINRLGGSSAAGSGSGASTIAPDFSGAIHDAYIGLATDMALVVLGALLTFSGVNIPLGIGMIALGAYGMYKTAKEDPAAVKRALDGWLGDVIVIAGFLALGIGVVLTFSGLNIALGIGLILTAAFLLGTAVTFAPEKLTQVLSGWLGEVIVIAGLLALAIGIVLTFSGLKIALGIGLILLGAVLLGTEATFAPEKLTQVLSGWLGEVVVIAGLLALAIGIVLTFSGTMIALGIGLILLGVALLGTEAIAAPEKLTEVLSGWLGEVVVIAGLLALGIGIVLTFSGLNILLGVGLIMLGAMLLGAEAKAAPEKLREVLEGWVGDALIIVGMVALVLGVILLFIPGTLMIGVGLIALGAAALFAESALAPEALREKMNGWLGDVIVVVGTIALVLGIILLFVPGMMLIGFGLIALGLVAYKAVEPDWTKLKDRIINAFSNVFTGIKDWWNETVVPWFKNAWSFVFGGAGQEFDGFKAPAGESSSGRQFGGSGARTQKMPAVTRSEVPHLATGAVIPPNREFAAVLGDQTNGNNLEAPEGLLRKIVREEGGGDYTGLLQQILAAIKDGKILMVDDDVFARVIHEASSRESSRRGMALVTVG